MSFFEKKIITVKIRNRRLKFIAVSQSKLVEAQANWKYYQKLEGDDLRNPELLMKATEEVLDFILSYLVTDDNEDKPTVDDLKQLTTAEINDIVNQITSVVELQQLNVKK